MAGANVRRWGPVSPEPRPTREGQVPTLGCSPLEPADKAHGVRTPQGIEIALFHPMGNLPEPKISRRFC